MNTAAITEQLFLEGSWLALEQAGSLLRDAIRLHEAGSYATAVRLALLGREELGRSLILRDCSAQVHDENVMTAEDIRARCGNHEQKQAASPQSVALTTENDSDTGSVARASLALYFAPRDSPDWLAVKVFMPKQQLQRAEGRLPTGTRLVAVPSTLTYDKTEPVGIVPSTLRPRRRTNT
jgi:AbiV family abortive infection protein